MQYNVYIQNAGLLSEFANDESGQRDHYEKDYMLNLEHERAFSHNLCNAHQEVFGSAVIPTKQLICGEQGSIEVIHRNYYSTVFDQGRFYKAIIPFS